MISIERVKELLRDQDITDEEAREIRDSFRELAEIIFEQWQKDRIAGLKSGRGLNKSKKISYDGNSEIGQEANSKNQP